VFVLEDAGEGLGDGFEQADGFLAPVSWVSDGVKSEESVELAAGKHGHAEE